MRTAMYYPPIWKDGVNTNPDGNITTTEAHCCECHYDFTIKEQFGKEWTEEGKYNPPKPPLNVNITAGAYSTTTDYVPYDSTHLATAVIDNEGKPVRKKTKTEKDIEELKNEMQELKALMKKWYEATNK